METAGNRTLVLASGGLDSSTLIPFLLSERGLTPSALFFDRGQRVVETEKGAVEAVCSYTNTPWEIVSLVDWRRSLPSDIGMEHIPRNAILVLLALPFALVNNCSTIAIGSNADDRTTPDSSRGFVRAMNDLLDAVGQSVSVVAPFLELGWGKYKIASWAKTNMGDGFIRLTYSCHEQGPPMCGDCPGCRQRWMALSALGIDEQMVHQPRIAGP